MRLFRSDTPIKITVTYIVISLVYICLSDVFLKAFSTDIEVISRLQTVKGAVFVLLSGGLLFFMINKYSKELTGYYSNLINERKKSFDELKLSEEKYWTVFNASPLPMWIYSIDNLRFLLVNDAACKKYGYSQKEFLEMGINDIRPQEDVPKVLDAIKQIKGSKNKLWKKLYRHICKNGDVLDVKIESAEILFDNTIARLVIATDVTEKVKNDEVLAEANLRLKSASNIANLGYWSHDLRTSKIYWSDTLYNIFEIDKDTFNLTWENVRNLFHNENTPHLHLDEVFNTDEIKEFEHRIKTGCGNEKWILERISVLRNNEGTPILIEGIALDITERKQILKALQSSNERFKMVAKAAVEAIIDWDIQSGEVFWGDGLQELFGYDPNTGNRTLWLKNIHPDDRSRVMSNLTEALSNKTTQYFFEDFRFLKACGQIAFVQHRGVFIRNSKGVAIRAVSAMVDMTPLKEKIITIEAQNNQLKEIAWVQSHVVRAPLATLMGLTNLLKESENDQFSSTEIIAGIIENANKLDDVIREIVNRSEQLRDLDDRVTLKEQTETSRKQKDILVAQ